MGMLNKLAEAINGKPKNQPKPKYRAVSVYTKPHVFGAAVGVPNASGLIRKHGHTKATEPEPRPANAPAREAEAKATERTDHPKHTGPKPRETRARNGAGRPPSAQARTGNRGWAGAPAHPTPGDAPGRPQSG